MFPICKLISNFNCFTDFIEEPVPVPSMYHGVLIGKDGEIINNMREQSGCGIVRSFDYLLHIFVLGRGRVCIKAKQKPFFFL